MHREDLANFRIKNSRFTHVPPSARQPGNTDDLHKRSETAPLAFYDEDDIETPVWAVHISSLDIVAGVGFLFISFLFFFLPFFACRLSVNDFAYFSMLSFWMIFCVSVCLALMWHVCNMCARSCVMIGLVWFMQNCVLSLNFVVVVLIAVVFDYTFWENVFACVCSVLLVLICFLLVILQFCCCVCFSSSC